MYWNAFNLKWRKKQRAFFDQMLLSNRVNWKKLHSETEAQHGGLERYLLPSTHTSLTHVESLRVKWIQLIFDWNQNAQLSLALATVCCYLQSFLLVFWLKILISIMFKVFELWLNSEHLPSWCRGWVLFVPLGFMENLEPKDITYFFPRGTVNVSDFENQYSSEQHLRLPCKDIVE